VYSLFRHYHLTYYFSSCSTYGINFIDKIIAGDFSLACLNKSRTRDAPTPTNISTKSEPDREKMALALLQQPLANRVFPVPGGPTSKAPFEFYHRGLCISLGFQKLDNFLYFFFGPSSPATSLNVVFTSVFHQKFCF
jgi:hypothetical protein